MKKGLIPKWSQRGVRLRTFAELDLRSLALFRVALGLMLLGDLTRRVHDLSAFYTDSGVYPRKLLAGPDGLWRISLHAANGQVLYELALFLLAFAAAGALLAGWQTRRATFISWVLFVSLLNRVPILVTPGEMLLAALLFWAIFLPLNVYWSVDAATTDLASTAKRKVHSSWASVAILFQMIAFFTIVTVSFRNGSPVHTFLGREDYLGAVGLWVKRHAVITRITVDGATTVGLYAPFLLLVPVYNLRRFAVAALALVQLGAEIILKQNWLGWAALIGLIPLIDSGVWNQLSRIFIKDTSLRIYHDRNRAHGLLRHRLLQTFFILPTAELRIAQDEPRTNTLLRNNQSWIVIDRDEHAYLRWDAFVLLLRRSPLLGLIGWTLSRLPVAACGNRSYDLISHLRSTDQPWSPRSPTDTKLRIDRFVVPACVLFMLAANLDALGILPATAARILNPPARLLRLDQKWNNALPKPAGYGNGWFVAPGILANHRMVDAMRPKIPLDFSAPPELSLLQGNLDWHRYLDQLRNQGMERERARYTRFLCRQWNQRDRLSRKLLSVQLVYLFKTSSSDENNQRIEREILWRQNCEAKTTRIRGL